MIPLSLAMLPVLFPDRGMVVSTRVGPMLVTRAGSRFVIGAALALSAVALGLTGTTDLHTGHGSTAAWITVLGAGIGLVLPASVTVARGRCPTNGPARAPA